MVMPGENKSSGEPGFNEYLLGGLAVLTAVAIIIAIGIYLIPPEPLQLAELQPAYRVAQQADFPVGSSRVVNWGEAIVLVVRTDEQSYSAVRAVAPTDGCILKWDPTSMRVLSPCSNLVYDLRGNVVRGLTTVPLTRYQVFVRDAVVYISRS
jgi:nitrite reductase/ring-hydroxylating ferredoxin subunit